jgi:methionine synthase II (cobalamin-independent)
MPVPVHLVGSIGLDTVPEVFSSVGRALGPHLKRVPDGEPGGRRLWISFQYPLLRASPFLKIVDAPRPGMFPPLGVADGVAAKDIRFGELNYAREARASYEDFLRARKKGELPAGVRFQVCLPTPFAVISPFCTREAGPMIEPAYEAAMMREVAAICAEIPHGDLAIQWDVCIEMVMWDGRWNRERNPPDLETALSGRFARLSAAVPASVELGFHLCYGDLDGKHFIDPVDAGKMVEMAHLLVARAGRPIAWIHMPVPVGRSDDAFFAPLKDLQLPAGTELYLGVVAAADGVEGTKKRMAAARKYAPAFGIGTECGMARARTPDVVETLIRIHAEAAK